MNSGTVSTSRYMSVGMRCRDRCGERRHAARLLRQRASIRPSTTENRKATDVSLKPSISPAALVAAAVLVVSLIIPGASLARPERSPARAAAKCGVGSGEGYGYTYVTSLQVTGTTCATGIAVVRSKAKLKGWQCTRTVLDKSPVQYDAREKCSSGKRQVVYVYTQNT